MFEEIYKFEVVKNRKFGFMKNRENTELRLNKGKEGKFKNYSEWGNWGKMWQLGIMNWINVVKLISDIAILKEEKYD